MATSTKAGTEFDTFDLLAELELDNNEFKTALLQKVLANPTHYYELRNQVQKQIVRKSVQDIYNLLINFMYDGKLPKADGADHDVMAIDGAKMIPHIPLSQCKPKALATAQAIAKLLMGVVDEVLPPSHLELAQHRDIKKSELDSGIKL